MVADVFFFAQYGPPDANGSAHVAWDGRLGGNREFLRIHKHVARDDDRHDAAIHYPNPLAPPNCLQKENSD